MAQKVCRILIGLFLVFGSSINAQEIMTPGPIVINGQVIQTDPTVFQFLRGGGCNGRSGAFVGRVRYDP